MRIFLSYSERDAAIATKVAAALKNAKHELWKWDETLVPGDNIAEKTREGIERADAFLLLVSANSLSSNWVLHEFSTLALGEISKRNFRIIPVRIDDTPVPGYLSEYYYIDISKDIDAGIKRLIAALGDPVARAEKAAEAPAHGASTSHLAQLSEALQTGRLTLVCGAGISANARIPMWGDLLLKLLDSMIERLSREQDIAIETGAAPEFQKRYGDSAMILGKYLKNTLGKDFIETVRTHLYANNPYSSELIDAIVELARPRREGKALDSIITFNFDALIEENLSRARVANKSIFSEAVKHEPHEIPIYHVHGYLPRESEIPHGTDIVFSEDAYHSQFLDPFSWSNLIQLAKFSQNTCLLVGVSLTDPNLRRLLDVSWRKNADKTRSHFIIKRLPVFDTVQPLNRLAQLLEEQDANLLGINVIWVNDHDETPSIIRNVGIGPNRDRRPR